MADDQEGSNEIGDEGKPADYEDNDIETTPPITAPPPVDDGGNPGGDDYDEENIPDFHVKLIINDGNGAPPEITSSNNLLDVGIAEVSSTIPSTTTTLVDSINEYTASITQGIMDGLTSESTDIGSGKKSWWGSWPWHKILFVVLIALCIIGIILALLFCLFGKKFKKNKGSTPSTSGTTTTTKAVVTKGISPTTKYEPVRNV